MDHKEDISDNVTAGANETIDAGRVTTPNLLKVKYPDRLLQIFEALREECRVRMARVSPMKTDGPYCKWMVDAWGGCWPDTMAGTTANISCPDIPAFDTSALAYRYCGEDGSWYGNKSEVSRPNYTMCRTGTSTIEDESKYIYIFIGGFSVSLVMLLVALTIFFRFKQLRCDRITIHKNLFLSYVLTGISWILYYVLVALDGKVLLENPFWCRGLHVLCQYFTVCNFLWMFCEGLYLNTIMVCAFNSSKLLIIFCYIIGWGLPFILTAIYTIVRSKDAVANLDCWIGLSTYQWIMYGPIVLSIVINVIFLINIVRLLITKLRQMPEVAQTKKATRATLILVPLLGLQYLLFPIRPEPGSKLEDFYHIVVALLVSLQGAFVSIMYCFCNGEVITVMTRKYTQHRLMRKRSSIKSSSGHVGTAYTTIDHLTAQNNYNSMINGKEAAARIETTKFDVEAKE